MTKTIETRDYWPTALTIQPMHIVEVVDRFVVLRIDGDQAVLQRWGGKETTTLPVAWLDPKAVAIPWSE